MKREELIAKGFTEEQVTDILNTFHSLNKENEKLKSELLQKADYEVKYNEAQSKLDDINKANLTVQEQIELDRKEAEKDRKEAKILLNKTKVQNVLAGLDIDEAIINTLVTEDENTSINNANLLKSKFDTFKDNVEKQTKESIQNLDVKPGPSNVPQDDGAMTWDKFRNLSQEEQNQFATEHPQEFSDL